MEATEPVNGRSCRLHVWLSVPQEWVRSHALLGFPENGQLELTLPSILRSPTRLLKQNLHPDDLSPLSTVVDTAPIKSSFTDGDITECL